jgi:phosphoglycerate kinase
LHNIISVAGGGDVVAALKNSGLRESFSYLSTAGGAFLEWLQGDIGYGMKALQCNMKITKAS